MMRVATMEVPDLASRRADFPLLERAIGGLPIAYLDSAATSLKPWPVIEGVARFYREYTANVRRAVHALSEQATAAYEHGRATIAQFVGVESHEIIFVRNATEALNMVARSFAGGGAVALPLSEHHSNFLPWPVTQRVLLPVRRNGELDLGAALKAIRARPPALVTFSTVANALGTRAPAAELVAAARQAGALVLLDVSQSVGHEPVDLRALDADFACFSGHKMLAPSGVGVLYARETCLDLLRPLLVGGSMVQSVRADTYQPLPGPWGFEAGTPNVEGVLGLAAACDYLDSVGLSRIGEHGLGLAQAARTALRELPGVRVLGADEAASSIVTFVLQDLPAHGVARVLSNRFGIMLRSGYHCAEPLHHALGLGETLRASLHLYNTATEIERLVEAVRVVRKLL